MVILNEQRAYPGFSPRHLENIDPRVVAHPDIRASLRLDFQLQHAIGRRQDDTHNLCTSIKRLWSKKLVDMDLASRLDDPYYLPRLGINLYLFPIQGVSILSGERYEQISIRRSRHRHLECLVCRQKIELFRADWK